MMLEKQSGPYEPCQLHQNNDAECAICIQNRRDIESDRLNGVCSQCGEGFKTTGRWKLGDGYCCWNCVQRRVEICAILGELKFVIRGSPLDFEYRLLGYAEDHHYSKKVAAQIAKAESRKTTVGRSEGALPGGDHTNLTDVQKGALARAARGFYLYRRVRYPPRLDTRLDLDDPGIAHPRTIDSLLRRRLIEPDSGANSFRATVEGQAVYARRRRDWFSGVRMFATI